jgi:hypothetical protein
MEHANDPRAAIVAQAEPHLHEVEVFGVDVLIAIYQRPEKTAGGIYTTDKTRGEDLYQGKVGLVLKIGPAVTPENDNLVEWFGGRHKLPQVGDWVLIRVGDTYTFDFVLPGGKLPCRAVEAKLIRGRVAHPDLAW